ncbi:MAG: hypothetical protein WB462_13605 [Solirubrobacterales bacterium]
MSQENVELSLRLIDAWNRRDAFAVSEALAYLKAKREPRERSC